VLQRTTKPAKELIAQNPPQDCLQTRATSGLVFSKQALAADVAGGGSRWQQAGSGSKQAGLVTHCKVLDKVQIWREMQNAHFSLLWHSVARAAGDDDCFYYFQK